MTYFLRAEKGEFSPHTRFFVLRAFLRGQLGFYFFRRFIRVLFYICL